MPLTKLSKIGRQTSKTWALLHRRLTAVDFDFREMFSEPVAEFIQLLATSVSSSIGYVVSSLLVATAFILSPVAELVINTNQKVQPNLFLIFVGPPSTGKSQAMKVGGKQPLTSLKQVREKDFLLLDKTTSAGLMKALSSAPAAILISPEIGDILAKLVKMDSDSGSSDTAILCELFSGEASSMTLATSSTREIKEGYPFCILGATQMLPLMKLITIMDEGQGLLDRFIITAPTCLRPKPETTSSAISALANLAIQDINPVLEAIHDTHLVKQDYSFVPAAQAIFDDMNSAFIEELNEALVEGNIPPRSKKMDLISRTALTLHVLNWTIEQLLAGGNDHPPSEITVEILERAVKFVNFTEGQRNVILNAIDEILGASLDTDRPQPTLSEIMVSILTSPGSITTARSFKQSVNRRLRTITKEEFCTALGKLLLFGERVEVRVPRSATKVVAFLKKSPQSLQDTWPADAPCSFEQYNGAFEKDYPSAITPNIVMSLRYLGHEV